MSEKNDKTVAEIAAETKAAFDTKLDAVKAVAEDAAGRAAKLEKLSETQKGDADEQLTAMNGLKAQLTEIEQKMARKSTASDQQQSPGQRLVGSDDFKNAFATGARQGRSAQVKLKAITSLTTDADGSAGDLVRAERVAGLAPMLPDRRMTIRQLLAPGQTSISSIEYVQETGFTNNAGMTAEGAEKPESSMRFDLKTAPVRKIAHWMKASAEILADAPGLSSMIDYRLRYGLEYVEETQLLNGDGTGQNLLGLIPQATAYSASFAAASETLIDKVRLAMLQVVLAEYPATGVVINPIDWAHIELTKDSQGRYIIGNPQGTATPTLWGLPVVATQAISEDKFLVGGFSQAAQVFDRMDATVMVSTENQDDFIKNMVTVLAEERLAFTVNRPESFVYGDFGRVA